MLTPETLAAAARDAGLEPCSAVLKPLDGGGPGVALDPDAALYPASMIKTPMAVVAYDRVAAGELSIGDRVEITPANMTANDKPSPLVPGYRARVGELIELMITISDNVATNTFFDLLDRRRATEAIRDRYGLRGTAFRRKLSGSEPLISDPEWVPAEGRNTHPPVDAARLFEMIAEGGVPEAHALRAVLGCQRFNDRLSLGLRKGDRFYHKTGSTDEVSHDGGILETAEGRSYVLVVYTGLPASDEHDGRFGDFMGALRPLL